MMTACWRSPSPFPLLQFHFHSKLYPIPKPYLSETLFPFPTTFSLAKSSCPFLTSIPISPNPSLPIIPFSSTSDSASASDDPPSLFIRGLPKSTTEGRLRKAFAEFGMVNRVKILTDTITGQSLGIAYVWFVRQEFAQLAAKQMNGKFFDGRFIFVTKYKRSPRKRRK